MTPPTSKNRLNRALRWVGTVLAFALLVYLLAQQGWDEILAAIRQISAGQLFLAMLIMMLSRLSVVGRWHVLLRAVGISISLRNSARITFAGLFASNFLPTTIGGDVVRIAMALRLGFDRVVCAASVVVDRLVGMAGMGSAIPLGLPALLKSDIFAPQAAAVFSSMSFPQRIWERGRHVAQRLMQTSALWLKSPRGLLGAFAFTWGHQICLFGVVWLLLTSMGESISFWLVGGLWSLTYFITLLPISINGLGLQELSMTFTFSQLGGVSPEGAAVAALLVRTIQMLASLPGVAFLPDILAGMKSGDK